MIANNSDEEYCEYEKELYLNDNNEESFTLMPASEIVFPAYSAASSKFAKTMDKGIQLW